MFVVFVFLVALSGSADPHHDPKLPTAAGPAFIKPVGARASSFAPNYKGYTFGPTNLIDGSVETSWQPSAKASKDMLGVGQWFEIDLGATYDVSAWELEMGLQKVDPKLGDLFCRNTRPSSFYLLFDDGSYSWDSVVDADERRVTSGKVGITRIDKPVASARTRYVRFVIREVHDAVEWKDPAIAEIRLYGQPALSPVAASNAVCPSADFTPFVRAIIDHCAGLGHKARNRVGCSLMTQSFIECVSQVSTGDFQSDKVPLAPIDADALAARAVDYRFTAFPNSETKIAFVKTGETWQVRDIKRAGEPWYEHIVAEDSSYSNQCWESLGKTRPYELALPEGSPEPYDP